MPRFIAIHPVNPPVKPGDVAPVAKKCKAGVSLDAYWVSSWLQLNDKGKVTKVFCTWDGKDAESIRNSCAASIPELPFSEVYEMAEKQGEDFR